MADVKAGRNIAARFVLWGLVNLLAGGPALGLLAAYDAASDGGLTLKYPIFGTHSWLVMMGWCAPVTFALVFWLLPILKDIKVRYGSTYHLCLGLLVLGSCGLGAYLFLSHSGRSSLIVLPPAWACFLTASILYLTIVWRVCARTLRPTASDLGLSAGAVWLVIIVGIRLLLSLGALSLGRDDFAAQSDRALLIAMMLGFVVNTGLALASAIGPEFLMSGHSRPTVVIAFRLYNTFVALWCGGAAYLLPYPFGYGRFVLALVGIGLLYATARLLAELRMFELLFLRANSPRRRLARTALGSAGVLLILATITIVVISLWIGAMVTWAPDELLTLTMHLLVGGFFTCIVIGLFVPLLGNRSLSGLRLPLAHGAYLLLLLWLLARVVVALWGIITPQVLWYERYMLGLVSGGGALCLALWLLLALFTANRKSATPPQAR